MTIVEFDSLLRFSEMVVSKGSCLGVTTEMPDLRGFAGQHAGLQDLNLGQNVLVLGGHFPATNSVERSQL